MTDERYSDDEVSLILARALDSERAVTDEGLSLEELKAIAAEVGIDPGRVEAAALAVRAELRQKPNPLVGTPLSPVYEAVVDGELDPARYPAVLEVIRDGLGRHGVVGTVFGGIEWKARDALGGRYVSIHADGGRTRIRAMGNYRDGVGLVFGAAGTAGFVGGTVLLKALTALGSLSLLGAPFAVLAAVVPARLVWKSLFGGEDRALRRTVADLADRIGRFNREDSGAGERPGELPPGTDREG